MLSPELLDLIAQLPEATQQQVMCLIARAVHSEHPEDVVRELQFLLGVEVSESTFAEWEDTDASFRGRQPGT